MKSTNLIRSVSLLLGMLDFNYAYSIEGASKSVNESLSSFPAEKSSESALLSAPISSENLWDEVISSTEDVRIYDWRRARFELEIGKDDVDERTVFKSSGFHVGIGVPMASGLMVKGGLRRIVVMGTRAGDLIEKTPYRQPAQPNRYEIYGLLGYSLAEGRAFTRLSPMIGDCEHALSVEIGGHYSHPSMNTIPEADPEYSRVNGQLPVSSTWVGHVGARYVLYVPNGLGLFVTPAYEIPLSKLEGPLTHWFTFSIGAVISISQSQSTFPRKAPKGRQER